jgi:hypothetical protein
MTIKPQRIPYRPRLGSLVFGGIFFFFCGIALVWSATTEHSSIRVMSVSLSPHSASVFYWLLAGGSFLFVCLSGLLFFASIRSSVFLELTSNAVVIPRGFGGKRFRHILYNEIVHISELKVAGSKSLGIQTVKGLYWVPETVLPRDEDFEMLKQILNSVARANREIGPDITIPPQ